jgi:hypothetical protein
MAEDDGLPAAPVLIVDLDVFGIFFAYGNVWYGETPFKYRSRFSGK